jgi:type I restriction enzyme, S subunit
MSKWETRKLGEISEMCLGKMLDKEKNKGSFHPYLANLNVRWGSFELSNLQKMRFEDSEQDRYGLQHGDLVICEGGEPGRCAIWRNEIPNMKIQKALHRVRINSDYCNEFIYYRLFRAGRNGELSKHFIGSTIKHLTGIGFKQVEFLIPSLGVQRKIAEVLRSLDAKIELNNKINTELEAMAKLIYDYWFVQFDFPDANGTPYKSSGGKMVYNKALKREIPEGWKVKSVEQIEPSIITGKTPSTKVSEYFNGSIPFICIGDVRGNMHITKTELTLTQLGADSQANKYIPAGSICVTCIASPGLVGFATQNSQTNQQLNSIVCKEFENKYFLYFYLNDHFKFAKAKTGNTFANMNKSDFSSIKAIKPNKEVLENFSKLIQPSIEKILVNSKENNKLAELRDWLLPMLMNGQVTVEKAEEKYK